MSHARFFKMLEHVPRITHLWNKNMAKLNIDLFDRELCVMSTGEVHMAKFFAAVWLHDNQKYGFDLVDAIAYIDPYEKALIINWINDPFWP